MTSQKIIYQLKLTLSHISPPIWRRVQVRGDATLYRLAVTIINAMGWHGGHLHQFRIGEKYYELPDEESASDPETIDEREVQLKDIIDGGVKRFIFEYDFGDGWEHEVEFEGIVEPEKRAKYPRCIKGARQCPPEDCGGPLGYKHFLEAVRNPKHPEHKDMREWIGGDFDPEELDIENLSDLADAVKEMEKEWNDYFQASRADQ